MILNLHVTWRVTGVRRATALCCAACMLSPALAADKFSRLGAAGIKAQIVGKVVTDKAHWSDRYDPDGTLTAVDLGVLKPGTWKLEGNEMCVIRKATKPVTECFEIWIFKYEIEYRCDGVTLTSGVLRNE